MGVVLTGSTGTSGGLAGSCVVVTVVVVPAIVVVSTTVAQLEQSVQSVPVAHTPPSSQMPFNAEAHELSCPDAGGR
jgi:hypothetical protein